MFLNRLSVLSKRGLSAAWLKLPQTSTEDCSSVRECGGKFDFVRMKPLNHRLKTGNRNRLMVPTHLPRSKRAVSN